MANGRVDLSNGAIRPETDRVIALAERALDQRDVSWLAQFTARHVVLDVVRNGPPSLSRLPAPRCDPGAMR
jgi:hypothetical protein